MSRKLVKVFRTVKILRNVNEDSLNCSEISFRGISYPFSPSYWEQRLEFFVYSKHHGIAVDLTFFKSLKGQCH
jgi:hypothetical protein